MPARRLGTVRVLRRLLLLGAASGLVLYALAAIPAAAAGPVQFSGRYPHLAVFNHGGECGIGAVVPWADRLWLVTYSPHAPGGSDDKLYEIDGELNQAVRPESVGGTPANRMIHRESGQLSIGPYFIDAQRHVRVVPPSKMFGRLTATMRHLADPAGKLYIYDMEGLLYEVDVHSLDVKLLFKRPVPGWHAKGAYTGQGRLVLANNGESAAGSVDRFKPFDYFIHPARHAPEDAGSLTEWDGKEWRMVRRRQFCDVTGPGGILGAPDDDAPLWAIGWDKRSLILELLDHGRWQAFRMPKADYSYDGAHGWHTEWPRIREVAPASGDRPARLLLNMHGGWFDFPQAFAARRTAGLRPLGDYLKITGDFCGWKGRVVFGCDDAAKSGFTRGGPLDPMNRLIGQSNSNLWFTTWEGLSRAGRPAGFGGPWVRDDVKAGQPSMPYLFSGYAQRVLHLAHGSAHPVTFAIEIDRDGDGRWRPYRSLVVPPGGYVFHVFREGEDGQWVRLAADRDAAQVTAYFHYGPGGGVSEDPGMFAALADWDHSGPWSGGVVRPEGDNRIMLGAMLRTVDSDGRAGDPRSYQVGPDMRFVATDPGSKSAAQLRDEAVVDQPEIALDEASVIVTEGKARFRLPRSVPDRGKPYATGWPRVVREVVTERSLLNAAGSLYVLPRASSGGVRHLKPVCSHRKRITDFCSWRGVLVIAGCRAGAAADGHYVAAGDGPAGLWFGDVDDLWKLGKPRGTGGPWRATAVRAGEPSDPYLMTGYDRKRLDLSHDAPEPVTFAVEVDFLADGAWHRYAAVTVPPRKTVTHEFPAGYSAHWVRLTADRDGKATATFRYD